MNHKSIWCERQNKPSYIVRDLQGYVEANIVYKVLLRRGVFKWFIVRRKLIKLKNIWKERVKISLVMQKQAKNADVNYWRGYRKGVEECRKEVRELCHSDRWQAPDFDREAQKFLDSNPGV